VLEQKMKRLGILITHAEEFENVWHLARAAGAKGVAVHVHLTGGGVLAARDVRFERLCTFAKVTICGHSIRKWNLEELVRDRFSALMATSDQIMEVVTECDRSLVF
jgi:NADPH-dependent curcumin reductase CurA